MSALLECGCTRPLVLHLFSTLVPGEMVAVGYMMVCETHGARRVRQVT